MTRALITGCTGCLGSNLAAALLNHGVEVIGVCLKGDSRITLEGLDMTIVEGDILHPDGFSSLMKGVDWVFHVAGIADDWNHHPARVYRTNVVGTCNVLEAALRARVRRVVLTASGAVLGTPQKGHASMDEECIFNLHPRDWIYGHSKVLAESVMMDYVQQGLDAVCVLPTALMGPGDQHFITGTMIQRTLKEQVMPFPDGGANVIDVRDAAEGHIAAAERGATGARYILGGHNLTHRQIVEAVARVLSLPVHYLKFPRWALPVAAEAIGFLHRLGIHLPIDRGRVYLSGMFMYYDNRKAVRELGLSIRPFEDTIRDAYEWYVRHDLLEPVNGNAMKKSTLNGKQP